MIKLFVLIPLMCISLLFANSNDTTLLTYKLSQNQENQFSRKGELSQFWSGWHADSGTVATYAYLNLKPPTNIWERGASLSDSTDAQVKVYSAYGDSGLYILFRIVDNAWLAGGLLSDVIDFYLDSIASNELNAAKPESLMIGQQLFWTLSKRSVQYTAITGNTNGSLPSRISVNYFDSNTIRYNQVGIDTVARAYEGLEFDLVKVNERERALECRIPWKWVGNRRLGTIPDVNSKVSFSFRYLDIDGITGTGEKSIVWREKIPLSTCDDIHPSSMLCKAWGDIEITGQSVGVNGRSISFSRKKPSINNSIQLKISQTNKISPYIVSEKQGTTTRWSLTGRKWHIRK